MGEAALLGFAADVARKTTEFSLIAMLGGKDLI